jgi:hypothetical protein
MRGQLPFRRALDSVAANADSDAPARTCSMKANTLPPAPIAKVGVTAVLHHLPALAKAGIALLQLSPLACDTVRVADVFRGLANAHRRRRIGARARPARAAGTIDRGLSAGAGWSKTTDRNGLSLVPARAALSVAAGPAGRHSEKSVDRLAQSVEWSRAETKPKPELMRYVATYTPSPRLFLLRVFERRPARKSSCHSAGPRRTCRDVLHRGRGWRCAIVGTTG